MMHGQPNIKICYKVASCWLFLLIHSTMRGSMNIKLIVRIAVVLFGCDTVKFGRRLRTSPCLHGAWTYVHHAALVVREVCEL